MAFSQSEACAHADIAALNPTTFIASCRSSTASLSNWSATSGLGGTDLAQAEIAEEYTTAFGAIPWSFSMDRNKSTAFLASPARLHAFIKAPNVKTLGFKMVAVDESVFVVVAWTAFSKISKASSSLVGRALAHASMAAFHIRTVGLSTLEYSARASSVFPDRPSFTMRRSNSGYDNVFREVESTDELATIRKDDNDDDDDEGNSNDIVVSSAIPGPLSESIRECSRQGIATSCHSVYSQCHA
mmetsp:Transcript_30029/g.49852  ORF Transcript_30029/g.49852 Transcript_30029/m.49852 type:complete len:243 (+) Transcript_30029:427-1155(+)